MRAFIFFAFIASLLSCSSKEKKKEIKINETGFYITSKARILTINDTLIAFVADEITLVVYNLVKNKAQSIVNLTTVCNFDSLYQTMDKKIENVSLQELANEYNNGNIVSFVSPLKLNLQGNNIIAFFNMLTPYEGEYQGVKATFVQRKTFGLLYNYTKNQANVYNIVNKEDNYPYPFFKYSYYYKDTLLVSTFYPDSIQYTPQIFSYIIDHKKQNISYVKSKLLKNVNYRFTLNAKLIMAYTYETKTDELLVSDLEKIFNYTKGYVFEKKLFNIKNKDEWIMNFYLDNETLYYISKQKNDTIATPNIYLNVFNYSSKKHTKQHLKYTDDVFGFEFYENKLYYFERKNEDYYLSILPVSL